MSPYVHEDYRDILRAFFSTKKARSGIKSRFSEALSIKTSYLSQVLSDSAHLTPEQIFLACRYFDWDENETEYMLLCAQKDKCKDKGLKSFYLSQLRKLKSQATPSRNEIFQSGEASSQAYYRSWLIPAVHQWVITRGPVEQEEIHVAFEEARPLIGEALNTLFELGLLQLQQGIITATKIDVEYPDNSTLVKRYLKDCRRFALSKNIPGNTGQLTRLLDTQGMSATAMEKIIQENFKAVQASTSADLYLLNIDLIPVTRKKINA